MHGWRARVGLIVPSSNSVNEPEFRSELPPGVSLHSARLPLEDVTADSLAAMAENVEACAELLADAAVDIIAYGCTTGSLVKGPGYDEEIETRITERTGIPAVATAAAIKRAFEELGVSRLVITTPYIDDLNQREESFLSAAGYEVININGIGHTDNLKIGQEHPETAYRIAKDLATDEADGVFISCTNFRTFEIIESLETDIGKPVVSSNQATLWNLLEELEIPAAQSLGQLITPE
jgi:maleate isomerase